MRRRIRRLAINMLLLGIVAGSIFGITVRQSGFAAPTGAEMIGRTTLRWIDTSRPEVMTGAPDDRREVVVHLWYPAVSGADAQPAPYFPDLDALGPALAASGEASTLTRFGLRFIRTHALADAVVSPASRRYPVLIFSPGNATNSSFYTALVEELVSHGYVVAAIDHPYDVAAVRLNHDRIAGYAGASWPAPGTNLQPDGADDHVRFARARVAERARDAIFVLDQLGQLDAAAQGRFAGRLDLQRVGILGHSLGGMTAGDACQMDPRFKAGLNLDGLQLGQPFYPVTDGRSLHQPFMLITKAVPEPAGEMLARMNITHEQWQARHTEMDQGLQALLRGLPGGGYRVIVDGADHGDFTDVPQLAPALFSAADGTAARRMRIIAAYTRAFFDHTLLDRPAPLLDGATPEYPEVLVERYGSA